MSGLDEAQFVVSLDTSQLVQGSQVAKQTFQEMANSGVQSMQTIQINADIQAELDFQSRLAAMSSGT